MLTYESSEDAVEKAKYLLNNPQIAKQIAEAGQKKTFTDHTIQNQLDKLVFYFNNLLN